MEFGKTIHFKEELPLFLDLSAMELTRINIRLVNIDGTELKLLPNANLLATFAFMSK